MEGILGAFVRGNSSEIEKFLNENDPEDLLKEVMEGLDRTLWFLRKKKDDNYFVEQAQGIISVLKKYYSPEKLSTMLRAALFEHWRLSIAITKAGAELFMQNMNDNDQLKMYKDAYTYLENRKDRWDSFDESLFDYFTFDISNDDYEYVNKVGKSLTTTKQMVEKMLNPIKQAMRRSLEVDKHLRKARMPDELIRKIKKINIGGKTNNKPTLRF